MMNRREMRTKFLDRADSELKSAGEIDSMEMSELIRQAKAIGRAQAFVEVASALVDDERHLAGAKD